MQAVIEKAIRENVSQFLGGLETKSLTKDVLSGNIVFENAWIRPDVLQRLDYPLPICIIHSNITMISLKINWSAISSSPVELRIEGVTLLLRPITPWKEPDPYWIKANSLLNLAEKLENQFRQKKETLGSGYIAKLVQKVFDNIHIVIGDLHIRYEDDAIVKDGVYSIGLTVESFKMFTTDQSKNQKWVDRTAKDKQNDPLYKLAE